MLCISCCFAFNSSFYPPSIIRSRIWKCNRTLLTQNTWKIRHACCCFFMQAGLSLPPTRYSHNTEAESKTPVKLQVGHRTPTSYCVIRTSNICLIEWHCAWQRGYFEIGLNSQWTNVFGRSLPFSVDSRSSSTPNIKCLSVSWRENLPVWILKLLTGVWGSRSARFNAWSDSSLGLFYVAIARQ